jgi:AAA15 family ATPase/GTPase
MDKRLVKVAQELNLGSAQIVEFLKGKGFSIENKPTSKVTAEMEDFLVNEFVTPTKTKSLRGLHITAEIEFTPKPKIPEKKSKNTDPDWLIHSFEVQNYRSLKNLKIGGLKRVTLITGKNNTGKSSLLEALSIWAVRGRFYRLLEIMSERNELIEDNKNGNGYYGKKAGPQEVLKIVKEYEPLFFNRKIDYSGGDAINLIANGNEEIHLRFVKYVFDGQEKKVIGDEADEFNIGFRIGYLKSKAKSTPPFARHLVLADEVLLRQKIANYPKWLPQDEYQYLGTQHPDKEASREQLSKITLTDMEDELVRMLKGVEKNIQRIGFSGEKKDNQIYVRLDGYREPVLLTSMGDGMSRITAIMLALANSKNGFLLVDEFENGLHWTVQEQLWEVIFRLSKQLNVQVFATTHSDDCIRAFSNVMNKSYMEEGVLMRLDNKNGEISPTVYSPEELAIATENLIETRGL